MGMKGGVELDVGAWVCEMDRLGTWVSLGVLDSREGDISGVGVEHPAITTRPIMRRKKDCFMDNVDYNPDHIKSVGNQVREA